MRPVRILLWPTPMLGATLMQAILMFLIVGNGLLKTETENILDVIDADNSVNIIQENSVTSDRGSTTTTNTQGQF